MRQRTCDRTLRLRAGAAALVLAAIPALAGCGGDSTSPDTATDPGTDGSESASSAAPTDTGTRKADNIVLSEPAEGAAVSGSFVASGKANSPEANVPWEVRDESGKAVEHGFATATGWMDKLYPWKTKVDVSSLDPGTYTFVAMTDDQSGGEGKPAEEVSATITVG